jgi:uncharacterized membrane protein (UPF0127 family)
VFPRLLRIGFGAVAFAAVASCAQGAPSAQALGPGCVADGRPQTTLPREKVTIETARGPVRLDLQVAADDRTRAVGLMFVRNMPADQGMLFDFHQAQPVSFWMHNTYIPLDLLFVDADGRILNIASRARPCDDAPIPSDGAARVVIELNAGTAERLGIRPGDRVTGERIFPGR